MYYNPTEYKEEMQKMMAALEKYKKDKDAGTINLIGGDSIPLKFIDHPSYIPRVGDVVLLEGMIRREANNEHGQRGFLVEIRTNQTDSSRSSVGGWFRFEWLKANAILVSRKSSSRRITTKEIREKFGIGEDEELKIEN